MKYLTSDGRIIAGSCKTELLLDWKNSSYRGINQKWENFFEALSLRLYMYHQMRLDADDICGIIDKLEELGVLLRVE